MTYEDFVTTRTRALLGLAIAMSGDRHLAEDLVQDVLIKLHRHWPRVSAQDDPFPYVRRMLTNEYVSWRRKWARIVPFSEIGVESDRPDDAVTHADRQALQQQLRTLTNRQRAVLALRYYSGLSDREIAATLGCTDVAVRTHASRALTALRAHPELLLETKDGGQ